MRALLFLAFASLAAAQADVYWSGSLTTTNQDYEYRSTSLTAIGSSLIYESVDAQSTGSSSGTADVISGSVFAIPSSPLYEYLMYYASSASYTAGTVSYSGTSSMVGASYLSLTEVETNGNQLSSIPFSALAFADVFSATTSGALQYATYTGTSTSHSGLQVSLTFIASSAAGKLTNGAVVTPKSLELTVNILNYPFQSTTSSLVLTVAIGIANGQQTGSFTLQNGQHQITSGTGKAAAYFSGSASAIIDLQGHTATVNTSFQANFDASTLGIALSTVFNALVSSKALGTLSTSYQIVNFSLPNSANITYDPTIGYSPMNSGQNAGTVLSISYSLLLICFILLSFTQF
jgi:hypothetical protein